MALHFPEYLICSIIIGSYKLGLLFPCSSCFHLLSLKPSSSHNNNYWRCASNHLCLKTLHPGDLDVNLDRWKKKRTNGSKSCQRTKEFPDWRCNKSMESHQREFINSCCKVASRPVSFFFFFFCVCQRSLRMFSSLSSCNKVTLIGVWEIKITPVGLLSLPETAEIAQRSDMISGSRRVANIQSPSLWGIIAACFLRFGPKEV